MMGEKYTLKHYPDSPGRCQIFDGERLIAIQVLESDAKLIVAALNFARPAFRILRSIRDSYEKAIRRSGRQSWMNIAKGMAGIATVVLHDTDLPPELQ